jgi:hypothetical protein
LLPGELEDAVEEVVSAEEEALAGAELEEEFPEEEDALPDEALEPPVVDTPGFCVNETNCEPAAIGPEGFATQDPAGLRGDDWPNGMVPGCPTATLPVKSWVLTP